MRGYRRKPSWECLSAEVKQKQFNNMVKFDLINVQDFNNKWSKNIQTSSLTVVVIDTSDHLE